MSADGLVCAECQSREDQADAERRIIRMVDREIAHLGLSELVIADSMHTRKAGMSDRADGFVALPGGYGTLDEVLEILTWNQLGSIAKPVAFLDVNGYYDSLFQFFDDSVAAGLIKPAHRVMAQRATTVAQAIEIATGPAPASPRLHSAIARHNRRFMALSGCPWWAQRTPMERRR